MYLNKCVIIRLDIGATCRSNSPNDGEILHN